MLIPTNILNNVQSNTPKPETALNTETSDAKIEQEAKVEVVNVKEDK